MSLLREEELQAIRDFSAAIDELREDLNDSAFDLASVEVCMNDVLEAWDTVKAVLGDEPSEDDLDPATL